MADLCTLMYNLRVLVVVEQPALSKFFKFGPVRVPCMHLMFACIHSINMRHHSYMRPLLMPVRG